MFETFTPVPALIGGALIGLAASGMLLFNGRIAGISGILGGVLSLPRGDTAWRLAFLAGLVGAGLVLGLAWPAAFTNTLETPVPLVLLAGLLVGFGTRMGNGCTSGHGICGLTRLSVRSLVAVLSFMATGFATATAIHYLAGGAG
jgi:uncharacterized membrane protein YedE/YeeE